MTIEIRVPTLGESVVSATVARWMKRAGEHVFADEPIVELETDKVTVEIPSPEAGTLTTLEVEEGAEVEVGTVLALLEGGSAPAATSSDPSPAPAARTRAGVSPPPAAPGPVPRPATPPPDLAAAAIPSSPFPVAPMPAAAKLMAERSLSPDQLGAGTGKQGRITKGDVLQFLDRPAPSQSRPAPAKGAQEELAGEKRVPMTRLRRTVALRLKEAQNTAAMLTTFNEVDMGAAMALRADYRDAFEKRHGGVRLGFMSFFVRAAVAALKEFPAVNAEIDADEIIYKDFVHMGIAVGGPHGLIVPVLRNADKLGFADIERGIADFGRRAREGQLKLDELSGGTFTISNGGVYGSLLSTPILNAPQSGILGMHKIQERPMAVGGKVEIRPMMYLALSYDHRIVDGKEAVSFLVRVKERVEDPRRLLLDL